MTDVRLVPDRLITVLGVGILGVLAAGGMTMAHVPRECAP